MTMAGATNADKIGNLVIVEVLCRQKTGATGI